MVTRQPCSSYDALSALLTKEYFTIYDSRCIEINLRPYLPPRLEYQYPGESKQTIYSEGGELTYTLKEIKGQCSGDSYKVTIDHLKNGADPSNSVLYNYTLRSVLYLRGKIYGLGAFIAYYSAGQPVYALYVATQQYPTGHYTSILIYFKGYSLDNLEGIGKIISIENTTRAIDCTTCTFTVTETFDDGTTTTRHQETRDICPTVQQFDCALSEVQTIKAEAKPFEVFFISDGYEFGDGLINSLRSLIDTSKIDAYLRGNPINCFLLWKLRRRYGVIFDIIDVAQVCSAPGCPPPEMNYRCLSCCEKCPDNTCPIECGDHVCCYDDNGKSIKEIPIENYCDE